VTAIVVASVVTPWVVQHQTQARLRDQDEALRQQTDQLAKLREENQKLSNQFAEAKSSRPLLKDELSELMRLRGEVTRLQTDVRELKQPKTTPPLSRIDMLASKQKLWSEQLTQLKQRLETNPSEKVPELQYLKDSDWLRLVYLFQHKPETDGEYRYVMSALRSQAESRFAERLQPALRQYAQDNNGQFPTDLSQLKPYSKSPIDDAILQRYEILPASNLVSELQVGEERVITQKAPVNAALDTRIAIGLTNMTSSTRVNTNSTINNPWVLVH
jgi:hypothetical protein